MAVRMIKVRSKLSGDVTTVSERAFALFADNYERLDQPPAATAPATPPAEPSAPAGEQPPTDTATPPTSARRPAARTDKEQ